MKIRFRRPELASARTAAAALALMLLVAAAAAPVHAVAPYPTGGTRVVDGDTSDWSLGADFFANMYRAGDDTKPIDSTAYLTYDCGTGTLYVLVLAVDPIVALHNDPGNIDVVSWVAIDDIANKLVNEHSGNDGSAPDFEWIDQGFDGDPTHARGYEAAIPLPGGTFEVIVHMQVIDEAGQQTSAFAGFPLEGLPLIVDCAVPAEDSTLGRIKSLYR